VSFTDDLDFDETLPGLYDLKCFPSHNGMKQQGYYDDAAPRFDQPQGDYFKTPTVLMPNLQRRQRGADSLMLGGANTDDNQIQRTRARL